ncbi:helix-turn-helix transcriptional regulator [Enterococcus faecalis]|uniref:helix-turn-helix domain-containing protein n=1 Tax=Enterococcus faecalis TaxID=1351 RepID=UPI0019E99A94|nr:helix-turn-helix transcriptional regulator [Enterococcus faecalis]EMF0284022.1 helix-turn-helix transcriptional regulator [Enterococcus hirae]EGO8250890.1 helix-turn-helix transcriptional regulator [Enterococcus faecalis]EMF0298780.1 helix-turn-helix transcriptional regulator [Enterococcus hirae]MBW4169628.1 helix-turn-helix transcriptional regulator [Enterococcus faecalis]MBW4173877.1 helix-turn-helix transcriptional regulator [Enterococcus faecalis]
MTSIDKKNVGARIKTIRLNFSKKPMSQTRFGELFNPIANRSSVQKWESGKSLPNDERLKQIAFLGGTTIDYLLYGNFRQSLGYGERIRQIRENELNMTREEFASSFNPPVTENEIRDWENELAFPPKDYLKYIAQDGHMSVAELIYKERKFSSPVSPYLSLETIENTLDESNLSFDNRWKSDIFFKNLNELRYLQIKNPPAFDKLNRLIEILHINLIENTDSTSKIDNKDIKECKRLIEEILKKN